MSIFYAYLFLNDLIKINWQTLTPLTRFLVPLFQDLYATEENIMSSTVFNNARDELRTFLSNDDPMRFRRYGDVGAPVEHIFDFIKKDCSVNFSASCQSSITTAIQNSIPSILLDSLWATWCNELGIINQCDTASTQDWIDLATNVTRHQHATSTSGCNMPSGTCNIYVHHPPPLITFEIPPTTKQKNIPNMTLNIKTFENSIKYKLRSIIYHGNFHFTARLFNDNQFLWSYDGQQNNGVPLSEKTRWNTLQNSEFEKIITLEERKAHLLVYAL
jgi:hypothetical protein